MTIEVVSDNPSNVSSGDLPSSAPTPVAAAPGSPLIDLRNRRQAKINALHLDLKVPRWEEEGFPAEVWIRYRPAKMSVSLNAVEKRQGQKHEDWMILANADTLVDACVGVYVKVAGQPHTLTTDGRWAPFDPDTASPAEWVSVTGERATDLNEAFGIEAHSAADTLKGLFFTQGDLFGHTARLGEFSSKVTPETDTESLGE